MKKFLFAAAAVGAILIVSCQGDNRYPGYDKVENGTYFKVHSKGKGTEVADTGGVVWVSIKFKTEKDSVFMDVNEQMMRPSMPIKLAGPKFAGDFMDMFGRLHQGDSASYFINLDSLRANYPNEFEFNNPAYDTMQFLGFAVKMDSIWSRKKTEQKRAEADAEEQRQMVLKQKIQAALTPLQQQAEKNAPELKKKDKEMLKKYLADNKITEKPDTNGIYYRQITPGNGKQLENGMVVRVKYTGKYLDGSTFDSNELVDGQDPLEWQLGSFQMIPGFNYGVKKMHVGEKAQIILPPAMGYRDSLTRVFDVTVISADEAPQQPQMPPMPPRH